MKQAIAIIIAGGLIASAIYFSASKFNIIFTGASAMKINLQTGETWWTNKDLTWNKEAKSISQ